MARPADLPTSASYVRRLRRALRLIAPKTVGTLLLLMALAVPLSWASQHGDTAITWAGFAVGGGLMLVIGAVAAAGLIAWAWGRSSA